VDITVYLDNQSGLSAVEVGDEVADRMLAAEVVAAQLSASQALP
jgi:hypothetical protein